MAELLGRGEFARLAYGLGRARATGVLTVHPPGRRAEVMVLRRGHLMAASTDALGRQTSRRLAHLASMSVRYTFDSDTLAYPPGAVDRQFSLAAWARSFFEAELDAQMARSLVAEFTGARLMVAADRAPDPSLCDPTDLRILEALAQPSRLDQVWHHARTPRFRLLSFLYFLRCIDALEVVDAMAPAPEPPVQEDAWRLLGVLPNADRAAVKQAYRRLARALHPDLHPHASESYRRRLERRLAIINSAYVQLTSSTAA
jgi:DnaJ-domain-containing protein 1